MNVRWINIISKAGCYGNDPYTIKKYMKDNADTVCRHTANFHGFRIKML